MWNQLVYHRFVRALADGAICLDLGCGRGPMAPGLARIVSEWHTKMSVGVDLDERALSENKYTCKVRSDASRLPFRSNSFDLVVSDMLFEHLSDPPSVLKEIYRVLKPNGVVVIHSACKYHWELVAGRLLSKLIPHAAYRKMVSKVTGRHPDSIYPATYKLASARGFKNSMEAFRLVPVAIAYLNTPSWNFFPASLAGKLLPDCMKSTILSIGLKAAGND